MTLMNKEKSVFLKYLLIALIVYMIIPITIRTIIQPHFIALIANISFLVVFILLYILHARTQKTELVSNLLLIFTYIVLTIGIYKMGNKNYDTLWLLLIPLFSAVLLSIKKYILYSILSFFTILGIFYLFPETASFEHIYRIVSFSIFLIIFLYLMSRSRENAWKQTQIYVDELEVRVEDGINKYKEQEQLLMQTSKMASLGELLSSIAHQWKQPLSVISATSANRLVDEQLSDTPNEKIINEAQTIQEQVQFMSSTMDDFRSFFNSKDEKTVFSLNISSHELINIFAKDFKAQNIEIIFHEYNPELIEVIGYENMYKQALLNIIVNARDVIKVNHPPNPNIDIKFDKDNSYGIISIEDYAGQIPEDIIEKIFIKNFTTKGDKGSGIGLAMTKEIVEDFCNGKIEVVNTDNGVIFTIFIPLSSINKL